MEAQDRHCSVLAEQLPGSYVWEEVQVVERRHLSVRVLQPRQGEQRDKLMIVLEGERRVG